MYYSRLVEKEMEQKLRAFGAVAVTGPLFCGKTTTCMRYQRSFASLDTKQAVAMARVWPKGVLPGDYPRLIDEWQAVPDIWNQVEDNLLVKDASGKYILAASSSSTDHLADAGRIATVRMRPMSLWESKESKGTISLKDLFDGGDAFPQDLDGDISLADIAWLICRGGWPASVLAPHETALEVTKNYWESLFAADASGIDRIRGKKPEVLRMILRSYARHISTEALHTAISADLREYEGRRMDHKTLDDYLKALEDLYLIEDTVSWHPDIHSKTAIRVSPTRHFADSSIACQALGLRPEDLLLDFDRFGLLFEDMAVRDLRVYAGTMGGEVRHYRDNAGAESDAVILLEDGRWGAVEIKLGGDDLIDAGASALRTLKSKIEHKSEEKSPSFLLVLTAVGGAYRREDGIFVAPVNMLKP